MDALEYILGFLARAYIKLSTSYMPQTIVKSQFSYTVLQIQIPLKKKEKKNTLLTLGSSPIQGPSWFCFRKLLLKRDTLLAQDLYVRNYSVEEQI